ncbi:unnamed protein product [Rhizophagus irregularis]|nr:unnamed protein product [Rhizophagus irregularis]CAB4403775.1 unnamed protein product [Rhizophagus irregularis]
MTSAALSSFLGLDKISTPPGSFVKRRQSDANQKLAMIFQLCCQFSVTFLATRFSTKSGLISFISFISYLKPIQCQYWSLVT